MTHDDNLTIKQDLKECNLMFLLLLVSESTSFMYKIGHSAHSNPSDEKDSWFNFSYSMIFLIQCAFRIGILMLVDTSSFRTFIDTQLVFTRSPFCIVLYGPTSTWKGDRRRLRYDHRKWTGNHPKCCSFTNWRLAIEVYFPICKNQEK